jgi:hypothetical protein
LSKAIAGRIIQGEVKAGGSIRVRVEAGRIEIAAVGKNH